MKQPIRMFVASCAFRIYLWAIQTSYEDYIEDVVREYDETQFEEEE